MKRTFIYKKLAVKIIIQSLYVPKDFFLIIKHTDFVHIRKCANFYKSRAHLRIHLFNLKFSFVEIDKIMECYILI